MNKAELARHALGLRAELDLDAHTAFDPYQLAERYGIDTYQLSVLDWAPAAAHFTVTRPAAFSGALIPLGTGAVIVENDAHDRLRRRSTMAHEMAHWVRERPFACPAHGRRARVRDRRPRAGDRSRRTGRSPAHPNCRGPSTRPPPRNRPGRGGTVQRQRQDGPLAHGLHRGPTDRRANCVEEALTPARSGHHRPARARPPHHPPTRLGVDEALAATGRLVPSVADWSLPAAGERRTGRGS